MAELRDSSMLFSLKRLMDLERHRVDAEARRQQERADEERQARAERARIEREAEKFRAIQAERRRICEESGRRDGEARLRGIEQAAVERTRIETESRQRLAVLARQQAQERSLAALGHSQRQRRQLRWMVASVAVTLLTVAAALIVYFGRLEPEQARMRDAYRDLVQAEQRRADYAEKLVAEARREQRTLEREVERLQEALKAAPSTKTGAPAAPRLPPVTRRTPTADAAAGRTGPGECKKDLDPLNGCLG